MKSYSVDAYQKAGCQELSASSKVSIQMTAVHSMTGGKVCDTGCWRYNDGRCGAYNNLINGRVVSDQPTETVRAEAKRRNISISEVRRQRNAAA